MGQPALRQEGTPSRERRGSQTGELKHLSTWVEKANANPVVAASEPGPVQTAHSYQRQWPEMHRVVEETGGPPLRPPGMTYALPETVGMRCPRG